MEGIILSQNDYREHDVILRLLCKQEGYQSLIARGIRRITSKNAGAIQPFSHVKCFIDYHEGKTIHTMRTADVIESYRSIREDLEKQSIAAIICECMEKAEMTEGFAFLKQALDDLARTRQPYGLLALFFSCMNRYIGIEPYVDGCVKCGSERRICAISWKQGGFICRDCYREGDDMHYDKETLKCFRLLCKAQPDQFSIVESYQDWSYEHFMLVYRFFAEYGGIRLNSLRFMQCLQGMKGRKS